MIDISKIDYSHLDHREILMFLFHPRPEMGVQPMENAHDVMIPVEEEVAVGGRFFIAGPHSPNILFFHGNGEIVGDYQDLGEAYTRLGINFLPVDYRGYGRSSGQPTITAMMRDSHVIFDYATGWLKENGHDGPFIVMGRSLGSSSALELVSCYGREIDGLIIESGFAYAEPLLELLGINIKAMGISEEKGFRNIDKIRTFGKPALIIHAERDHIIPFSDGQALHDACPSQDKRLLMIPGANHNDILLRGLHEYMAAVAELVGKLQQ